MSVQFVLAFCHHSNRSWPFPVHHSWSLSPRPCPAPSLLPRGRALWPVPPSTSHRSTHFRLKSCDRPAKRSVFISDQGPPLPLRRASSGSEHPPLPTSLTFPPHTLPLPLLLVLSRLRNQPKSESIFVPCVTKYLCIIKDFSCVCAINY